MDDPKRKRRDAVRDPICLAACRVTLLVLDSRYVCREMEGCRDLRWSGHNGSGADSWRSVRTPRTYPTASRVTRSEAGGPLPADLDPQRQSRGRQLVQRAAIGRIGRRSGTIGHVEASVDDEHANRKDRTPESADHWRGYCQRASCPSCYGKSSRSVVTLRFGRLQASSRAYVSPTGA